MVVALDGGTAPSKVPLHRRSVLQWLLQNEGWESEFPVDRLFPSPRDSVADVIMPIAAISAL